MIRKKKIRIEWIEQPKKMIRMFEWVSLECKQMMMIVMMILDHVCVKIILGFTPCRGSNIQHPYKNINICLIRCFFGYSLRIQELTQQTNNNKIQTLFFLSMSFGLEITLADDDHHHQQFDLIRVKIINKWRS